MNDIGAIYTGTVFHERHAPFPHKFRYRVFTLWVDVDSLDALSRRLWLFSLNRFNVLGFRWADHGRRDGSPIRGMIAEAAKEKGIDLDGGKIFFLGFPRLWGFVFNPISHFFCYDRDGVLRAIFHQVKNTFGQQHGYFLPVTQEKGEVIVQSCSKVFHVSPFLPMDCTYHFRIREPGERFDSAIHQFTGEGKILTATWEGTRGPLTDAGILKAVLRHPLMTLKVVAAIHWEALKLWRKGAKYIRIPPLPDSDVT